ncbi:MAG TPA: hypothetical protein VMQ50_14515 [Casimicrobiaceae bacterium]|nr:hypothetical protein [Casimicrobiaceae bacterium]
MNKLLAALFASAFAFGMTSAFADDSDFKPLSKMETNEAKAAREAAKMKWDAMTPQEQAAAKKAARNKKLSEATALDEVANENMMYNAKQGAAETAKSKEQAKPTKEQRAQDVKSSTKPTTGQ